MSTLEEAEQSRFNHRQILPELIRKDAAGLDVRRQVQRYSKAQALYFSHKAESLDTIFTHHLTVTPLHILTTSKTHEKPISIPTGSHFKPFTKAQALPQKL